MSDPATGSRTFSSGFLSRYDVGEPLGQGGMGTVFRAIQRLLDRPVAIKVLDSRDPADEARFRREGNLLARLAHPHLVGIFEVETDGGRPDPDAPSRPPFTPRDTDQD